MKKPFRVVIVVLVFLIISYGLGAAIIKYLLTDTIRYYDVLRLCRHYALEPAEIIAIIETESGFNKFAESNKGALGLMQVMPETAREVIRDPDLSRADILSPRNNLAIGITYYAGLKRRFGSRELALLAYHSGPSRVDRWRRSGIRDLNIADYPGELSKKYVDDVYKNELKWRTIFRLIAVMYPYLIPHLNG